MAKKILIKGVSVGGRRYYAGDLLDEAAEAEVIAVVEAAGGQLLDPGDSRVDAAAEVCRQMRRDGQIAGQVGDAVMTAAVAVSAKLAAGQSSGSSPIIEERFPAAHGYQAGTIDQSIIAGPLSAGEPLALSGLDFVGGAWFGFECAVPQLIVGTTPADVVAGTETGPLGAEVTATLVGTRFGEPLEVEIQFDAKGVYSFERAFDYPLVSLSTDVDVGAVAHLTFGKGIGTNNPIEPGSLSFSINGGASADAPSLVHEATGTIVPGGDYNPSENEFVVRYRAATS